MSTRSKDMTRASFLSMFAAAPLVPAALAATSASEFKLSFHFCGDSYRVNTSQQTGGPYPDRLIMGGSGSISGKFNVGQVVKGGNVTAEGSFAHFEVNLPAGNNIPLQFIGTWRATELISFELLGLYGTDSSGNYPLAAGILVLGIELVRPPTTTIPLVQVPSTLTLVSSLGTGAGSNTLVNALEPAGIAPVAGYPDGVTLLAPNDPVSGFYFVPTLVNSTKPDSGEPHTSVIFGTLNEKRESA